jgi:hypothetical protein
MRHAPRLLWFSSRLQPFSCKRLEESAADSSAFPQGKPRGAESEPLRQQKNCFKKHAVESTQSYLAAASPPTPVCARAPSFWRLAQVAGIRSCSVADLPQSEDLSKTCASSRKNERPKTNQDRNPDQLIVFA